MVDLYSPLPGEGSGNDSTSPLSAPPEMQLWISLDIDAPQELGVGDARRRLPQLVTSAQHGQTYLVRNMNRPESEAVVIVSLNHLHRIAASIGEPINGGDVLSRLPFGDTAGLEALAPAPLPNPGLPRHLGALLRSDTSGDAPAAHR